MLELEIGKKYKYLGKDLLNIKNNPYKCTTLTSHYCIMSREDEAIRPPENDLWVIVDDNITCDDEIIFNAWDIHNEKMLYNVIVFNNNVYYTKENSKELFLLGSTKEYAPLQYIKNRDKDGSRIFDRDILAFGDNYLCVVFWDNNTHAWNLLEKYPKDEYDRYHDMDYLANKIKKVGNLFENSSCIKYQWEQEDCDVDKILNYNKINSKLKKTSPFSKRLYF